MRPAIAASAASAACSRNTSAGDAKPKPSNPIARPPRASCSQSAGVSPGAGGKARWRVIRRSESLTVPVCSPRRRRAAARRPDRRHRSPAPPRTPPRRASPGSRRAPGRASGMETAGLADMIQSAFSIFSPSPVGSWVPKRRWPAPTQVFTLRSPLAWAWPETMPAAFRSARIAGGSAFFTPGRPMRCPPVTFTVGALYFSAASAMARSSDGLIRSPHLRGATGNGRPSRCWNAPAR